MKRISTKTAIVVTVLAVTLALMQLSVVFQPPGKAVNSGSHSAVCMGNHELCGCAPERVAAKTCCCYRQEEPSCCDSGQHESDEKSGQDRDSSLPGFYAAPCGDRAGFIDSSQGKPDLFLPVVSRAETGEWRVLSYSTHSETPAGRYPEPPDPPPKVASLV
ncbi:hypothetical protein EPN96_11895 [bacterium]|nr:MAG: hypothetical protein EPN96_11895 [bacterium]